MRWLALAMVVATHFSVNCDCGKAPLAVPSVGFQEPAEGAFVNNSTVAAFAVSGTCSDIGQDVVLSGDATATVPCIANAWAANLDFVAAPAGTVTLKANHHRAAGTDAPEATRTFTKDVEAPGVSITSPVAGTIITPLNQSAFLLSGTCSEAGRTVTLSGPVAASTECLGSLWNVSVDLTAVADGALTVLVDHTDAAGNAAPTASRSFTKAANGPGVSFTMPGSGSFINAGTASAFSVSGFCTETGRPVVISGSAMATVTCTANAWVAMLDFTASADGVVTISVNHSDSVGNAAIAATRDFVKDTQAPTLASFAIGSASPTASPIFALTYGAQTGTFSDVCILEDTADSSACTGAWLTQSTLPLTFTVTNTPGLKALTLWLRDAAGNISNGVTSTNSVLLDTTAPTVTLTSMNGGQAFAGGSLQSITWTASDTDLTATPISLSFSTDSGVTWTVIAGGLPNSGSYSWTIPGADSAAVRVRVTVTDLAGNSGSATSAADFTIDSTAPVFSAGAMRLNGGVATSPTNFITAEFNATDSAARVTGYCLKYNSATAPLAADACWVSVPATASLAANANFRLGFLAGQYTVYAWARNAAGLVSSLTASGAGTPGQDRASVTYSPVTPPQLTRVTASSSDATENLNIPAGSSVFIKWNASSAGTLATNPISIFFTTDDTTYTQVAVALPNSQGTGCTVTSAETGCYRWVTASPTSGYFRIRVGAVDATARRSFQSTQPLNVGANLRVLAGVTDPGSGGSAEAAVFIAQNMTSTYGAPKSFIVSTSGTVYFIDAFRGILKVDPADGVQQVLIRKTGVTAIDGAVPGTATVDDPVGMTFDPQGRVLLFDYNRIRRFDPVAQTLTTIIGGGTSRAATVAPLALDISAMSSTSAISPLLVAPPGGKIYFQADTYTGQLLSSGGLQLRVYDSVTNLVTSQTMSGIGDAFSSTQNITDCDGSFVGASFDPVVGGLGKLLIGLFHQGGACPGDTYSFAVIDPNTLTSLAPHPAGGHYTNRFVTGADGTLYVSSRLLAVIKKFNPVAQTLTTIAGNGLTGTCPDGTAALACSLDVADVYGDANGQVYFYERGRIRSIDQAGNVYTVLGSGLSSSDGSLAVTSRVPQVNSIKLWNNGTGDRIVFTDNSDFKFREFAINGSLQTLAGTGTDGDPDLITPAATQPVSFSNSGTVIAQFFQIDPVVGTIYTSSRSTSYLSKIDRTTGRWVDVVGGGSTAYYLPAADGLLGNQINFSGNPGFPLGFDGSSVLVVKSRYSAGGGSDAFLKLYSATTGAQSAVAGVSGPTSWYYGSDGTAGTSSAVPYPYPQFPDFSWDSFSNRWVFVNGWRSPQVVRFLPVGGTLGTLATLPNEAQSLAYRHDASHNVIYYCDQNTGLLNKYNVTTMINSVFAPWPIAKMQCSGLSLIYSPTRNSLIFPFQQDGVGGIAEYLNP